MVFVNGCNVEELKSCLGKKINLPESYSQMLIAYSHECKGNASYNHLSIKQENIDLYYKNKPRIFATVPLFWEKLNCFYKEKAIEGYKEMLDEIKDIVETPYKK